MVEPDLTPRDLAKKYSVTQRNITRLAREGKLPGFRVGHLWRFRIRDIEEWENQGEIDEHLVKEIVDEVTL